MKTYFRIAAAMLAVSLSACNDAVPEPDYSGINQLSHTVQHASGSTTSQESMIRLYPNPFVASLEIVLSAPAPTTAIIYLSDENRKYRKELEVEVTEYTKIAIDFASMPKGLYLCEVHMAGQVSRYRAIKSN